MQGHASIGREYLETVINDIYKEYIRENKEINITESSENEINEAK